MSIFYVDASAWVKHYADEPGSEWMEQFWERERICACSELGIIEVIAALLRRRGPSIEAISDAVGQVETQSQAFLAVPLDSHVRSLCPPLLKRHLLRGADCVHLASAIYLRTLLEEQVVIVASDVELLAAARAEGFDVLNPAENPPVPADPDQCTT